MSWLSKEWHAIRSRYLQRNAVGFVFIHIPKTAGTSVSRALGLSHEHKMAREYRETLGQAAWDRKFKFTFVRNPWDKVVSYFHFKLQQNDVRFVELSFSKYLRQLYIARNPLYYSDFPERYRPQLDWISDAEGNRIVDFVGRFENIEEDFATICRRIGHPGLRLPHENASVRGDYQNYYRNGDAQIIADWYRKDIEEFGYSF
jgi:chondroitin 4-sulfotransferase 11